MSKKKKPCFFCQEGKSLYNEGREAMTIKGDTLVIEYNAYLCDSSWHEDIPINFCPFCENRFKL